MSYQTAAEIDQEHGELAIKISDLEDYIESEEFDSETESVRNWLTLQVSVMRRYLSTLENRLTTEYPWVTLNDIPFVDPSLESEPSSSSSSEPSSSSSSSSEPSLGQPQSPGGGGP